MSEVIAEDLLTKLSEAVDESRKRSEKLEKKYDSLDFEAMQKSDEQIAEISEKLSAMKVQVEAQENLAKQLEEVQEQQAVLAASIGTQAEKKDEDEISEGMKNFNSMLRNPESYKDYSKHQDEVANGIIAKEFKLAGEEQAAFLRKDLLVGSNPDGGYLVPTEFGAMITGQVFETSPIRAFASVQTTNSSEIEFPLDDQEADAGWVGEVQSRPDTATPTVGIIKIPIHELYAQPKATQKLLDDAGINIESWLSGKVSRRFSRLENTAFVSGDGSQMPKGFLAYPEWAAAGIYERNAIERINSGTSADFDSDSFKDLMGALKQEYLASAIFGMKRAVWTDVTKLKDSQNRYLFDMMRNFKEGDTLQILGKSVVLMDDMPVKAANSNSVVFGDFREGYTIADRIGIRLLRDPYTAKPFIKFYTTKRVGGAVTNYEALKIMKLAA